MKRTGLLILKCVSLLLIVMLQVVTPLSVVRCGLFPLSTHLFVVRLLKTLITSSN